MKTAYTGYIPPGFDPERPDSATLIEDPQVSMLAYNSVIEYLTTGGYPVEILISAISKDSDPKAMWARFLNRLWSKGSPPIAHGVNKVVEMRKGGFTPPKSATYARSELGRLTYTHAWIACVQFEDLDWWPFKQTVWLCDTDESAFMLIYYEHCKKHPEDRLLGWERKHPDYAGTKTHAVRAQAGAEAENDSDSYAVAYQGWLTACAARKAAMSSLWDQIQKEKLELNKKKLEMEVFINQEKARIQALVNQYQELKSNVPQMPKK